MIDRLLGVARAAEPPPLAPRVAERMIQMAVQRAEHDRRRSSWMATAATAIALVAAGTWWLRGAVAPSDVAASAPVAEPLQFVWNPAGDHVTASSGAAWELASGVLGQRRVALAHGAMLFEVAPLASGEVFEVKTPHARVTVTGTIFSVEVTGEREIVRVYEGHVRVEHDASVHELGAGEAWDVTGASVDIVHAPLASAATEATRARLAARPSSAPVARAPVADPVQVSPPAASANEPSGLAPELAPSLERVREWIADGKLEQARAAADLAAQRSRAPAAWHMLEADALRGLSRAEEAAQLYDQTAAELGGSRAAEAGYLAAYVRFHQLGDAVGCIRSLDAASADARGSMLAERALALRARALEQLGRHAEARVVARSYVDQFPGGGLVDWMRSVFDETP